MVINHNLSAMSAVWQYNIVNTKKMRHLEELSSGSRINRAADDAAGLAISEKMRRQISGLNQGIRNTQDGGSLCQVADGALNEVHNMIQRLEELSVQAANGTYTLSDKNAIQKEITQILAEIDRISDTTVFNEQKLFGGAGVTATPATPDVGSTLTECGAFTVQGGTNLIDFEFINDTLIIKTSTALIIRNTDSSKPTKNNRIEVAKDIDANITLRDVHIEVNSIGFDSQRGLAAFQIADDSKGNVNITLEGTNTFFSGYGCAGLQKNGEGIGIGTLTISGAGSLTSRGHWYGAGIGGGDGRAGSNITINGGIVTAWPGGRGAGIGGGYNGAGSNITINGGTVTAHGGSYAAGIGGGWSGAGSNITINGGTVTTSGDRGAGIGGGWRGAGSNITISGGTVTTSSNSGGAGIGGGRRGAGSNITISGGTVTASSNNEGGAGIGGGNGAEGGGAGNNITISGGTGKITGSGSAQNIGSGAFHAVNGTNNTVDGKPAPQEATDRNGTTYTYNFPDKGLRPPTGAESDSLHKKWWIQSGCEPDDGMFVEIDAMNTSLLGLRGMDVTTDKGAAKGMDAVQGALSYVSDIRSKIGAQQNRLEHTMANGENIVENIQASESRIRDADMVREMAAFSAANILAQASEAVLAHANESKQGVLELLR